MIGLRLKRYIIPKDAYEAWARSGSVYKAGLYMKTEMGLYNTRTGLPYTAQAIWKSAGEYIIHNLREARVIYEEVMNANGVRTTDKDWYAFVLPKILKLKPKIYKEFMATHSYLEPYVKEYLDAKK